MICALGSGRRRLGSQNRTSGRGQLGGGCHRRSCGIGGLAGPKASTVEPATPALASDWDPAAENERPRTLIAGSGSFRCLEISQWGLRGPGLDHRVIYCLQIAVNSRRTGAELGGRLAASDRDVPLMTRVNGTLMVPCGAGVGVLAVPLTGRMPRVTGVLGEQLHVLRSQFRGWGYRDGASLGVM